MIIKGSITISLLGDCNCIGCFYFRTHGGYMRCQKDQPIKQPIQPLKNP